MLGDAFRSILSLVKSDVTIERPGKIAAVSLKVTPSNYSRNIAAVRDVTISGREFVIDVGDLLPEYTPPKRGDVIQDPLLGRLSISEVNEMTGLGGELLGFRVRTS